MLIQKAIKKTVKQNRISGQTRKSTIRPNPKYEKVFKKIYKTTCLLLDFFPVPPNPNPNLQVPKSKKKNIIG